MDLRESEFHRKTAETEIRGVLRLDGDAEAKIHTGIPFFDHMLEQLVFHGRLYLELNCAGDLHIDGHHTIEDVAIALGKALTEALGSKIGIKRYASCFLPMDEGLTVNHLDISGRPYHVFRGTLRREAIGDFPTEMTEHFFYSLAMNAGLTLHQEISYGNNDHHLIESLFKGFGRALREAISVHGNTLPSTKGVL